MSSQKKTLTWLTLERRRLKANTKKLKKNLKMITRGLLQKGAWLSKSGFRNSWRQTFLNLKKSWKGKTNNILKCLIANRLIRKKFNNFKSLGIKLTKLTELSKTSSLWSSKLTHSSAKSSSIKFIPKLTSISSNSLSKEWSLPKSNSTLISRFWVKRKKSLIFWTRTTLSFWKDKQAQASPLSSLKCSASIINYLRTLKRFQS